MTTTAPPEREEAGRQPGSHENDHTSAFSAPLLALSSLRERRLLVALLDGPVSREALDRGIGTSNAPDVVFRLRQKGFAIPCELRKGIDRDGRPCHFGVYRLSPADADKARAVLAEVMP